MECLILLAMGCLWAWVDVLVIEAYKKADRKKELDGKR